MAGPVLLSRPPSIRRSWPAHCERNSIRKRLLPAIAGNRMESDRGTCPSDALCAHDGSEEQGEDSPERQCGLYTLKRTLKDLLEADPSISKRQACNMEFFVAFSPKFWRSKCSSSRRRTREIHLLMKSGSFNLFILFQSYLSRNT